jgi:spermidine synthase
MARAWLDRDYVASGDMELMRDSDNENVWWLLVDDVVQSIVDLADPTHLELEYVQRIGYVLDHLRAGPVDAVHIGGGACTIPRYLAAKRPGSAQIVIDPDEALIGLVRDHLALADVPGVAVRLLSGEVGVAALPDDSADLVVLDAFCGFTVPAQLVARAFLADVRRVLRPGGLLAVNVADGEDFVFSERACATIRSTFAHCLLLADPDVMARERFGNLVIAVSDAALPVGYVRRRAASAEMPARCLGDDEVDAFVGTTTPFD